MADIKKLSTELAKARAACKKADRTLQKVYKAYEKAVVEEDARQPFGIVDALNVKIADTQITNDRGYRALSLLSRETMKDGILFLGSHFGATQQSAIKVALNHKWDDDQLARTAGMVEILVEAIKPGNLANYNFGKPVKPTPQDDWRAFEIFEHTHCEDGIFYLARSPDGQWHIMTQRYHVRTTVAYPDLMAALRFIREEHWYEGGTRRDDDDY
jgi:hypothetical protein